MSVQGHPQQNHRDNVTKSPPSSSSSSAFTSKGLPGKADEEGNFQHSAFRLFHILNMNPVFLGWKLHILWFICSLNHFQLICCHFSVRATEKHQREQRAFHFALEWVECNLTWCRFTKKELQMLLTSHIQMCPAALKLTRDLWINEWLQITCVCVSDNHTPGEPIKLLQCREKLMRGLVVSKSFTSAKWSSFKANSNLISVHSLSFPQQWLRTY